MKDEYIHKIDFKTTYGNYEFVLSPFGLTNSLATFMCLMNNVLIPYLDKLVLVFVDNIFVYSNTKEDHGTFVRSI